MDKCMHNACAYMLIPSSRSMKGGITNIFKLEPINIISFISFDYIQFCSMVSSFKFCVKQIKNVSHHMTCDVLGYSD
jgi:hypothetical protein